MKRKKIKWNQLPLNMKNEYKKHYKNFYKEFKINKINHQNRMNDYLINCSHSEQRFWNIVNNKHKNISGDIDALIDANGDKIINPSKIQTSRYR